MSESTVTESSGPAEAPAEPDGTGAAENAEETVISPLAPQHSWFHIRWSGVVGGWVFMLFSLGPSLLPRGGPTQGLVTGAAIAIGYGLGLLVSWLFRQFTSWQPGASTKRILWWIAGVGFLVTGVLMLIRSYRLQSDLFVLLGKTAPGLTWFPITIVVSAILAVLFVFIARAIRRGARALGRFLDRWLPLKTARAIGIIVAGVLTVITINGVLLDGALSAAEVFFKANNAETSEGTTKPDSKLTSGGPDSVMSWESLGRKGRDFVGGVTPTSDLEAFSGKKATEPIRVYAGIESGNAVERAQLAVADLKKFGAFDRDLLAVGTTTGTGWVDELAVNPLEYMYNGNTAIVATQYSYLPSWISFLVDQDKAKEAAIELFEAIYSEWNDMPKADRPKLVVFGESLGSFGAEAAFSGLADIQNRTDGMMLMGPPNSNTLWSRFVTNRDEGSPEILPIYEGGESVRFAGLPEDVKNPPTPWKQPRVLYMQHASDPIVWWSPDLIFNEPDWLREPRGRDVLSELRYIPIITFLQISADMMSSTGYPAGHGHWYGENQVDGWAAVIPPDGWTDADTTELHDLMTPDQPRGS